MTQEQEAAAGERVRAFLADEAVKGAIDRVRASHFALFQSTDDPARIAQLHARCRALDEVLTALRGVVDNGHVATQRIAAEQQAQRRNSGRRN